MGTRALSRQCRYMDASKGPLSVEVLIERLRFP